MKRENPKPLQATIPWCVVALWVGLITFFSGKAFGFDLSFHFAANLFSSASSTADSPVLLTAMLILRKIAHLSEYAVLSFFLWTALEKSRPSTASPAARALSVFALCALAALVDEFHQLYVPGRVGQLSDVGLDLVGAAALLTWMLHRADVQAAE